MEDLFMVLTLAALVVFIVGMIKPAAVVFWSKKKTRGMACLYLAAMFVFYVLAGVVAVSTPTKADATSSSNTSEAKTEETPVSESPVSSEPEAKSYPAGMYKVGTDLPAGEYVLFLDGYFQVAKDSTGSLDSIICNDKYSGKSIVTVKDGQYLTVKDSLIWDINDFPKNDSPEKLSDGMYKVGVDLKPGEYKVHCTGGMAYCEVAKDSNHTIDSIISNDTFEGDKYITVKDGQYIKLSNAELILK